MRGCSCRGTAGFAHVSCLAEQAKILIAEAEENKLGTKVLGDRWHRWFKCSLCEQEYHGVVHCALAWACWKTYLGRPETDQLRDPAMNLLGVGLSATDNHEDALSVREAHLSLVRRLGASEENMLALQANLATTYRALGRLSQALSLRRDVYSATLKLLGQDHRDTLLEANNYAGLLLRLERCEEAKPVIRNTYPVAQRVLGGGDEILLRMRMNYAHMLCTDANATLGDLREAVTTLEDAEQTARRVLGGAHPLTGDIELMLQQSREVLRLSELEASVDLSALRAALDE